MLDFSNFKQNVVSKRQTIFLSSLSNPHFNSIFQNFSKSSQGKIFIKRSDSKKAVNTNKFGILNELSFKFSQDNLVFMFKKLDQKESMSGKKSSDSDLRLLEFHNRLLKNIKNLKQSNILVYIPDYYDYLRLKQIMNKRFENDPGDTFSEITEYDSLTKIKAARRDFATGDSKILLLTERSYYFFKKLPPVGSIKRIIFYGLPNFEKYFYEIVSALSIDNSSYVRVNFFKKDFDQLAGIVGKKSAVEIIADKKKDSWYFSNGSLVK